MGQWAGGLHVPPEPGAGAGGEGGSPKAQGRGGPCSPCGPLRSEVRHRLLSDIASFASLPVSLLLIEGRGRDTGRAKMGALGLLHRKGHLHWQMNGQVFSGSCSDSSPPHAPSLPSEVLLKILSYLDAAALLCAGCVNRRFYHLANDK